MYFWLANICHFLYICSIKFFRGERKKKSFVISPPQWFSPLYSVNLPSLQNTGSGSRYTYGINFEILGDFLHTGDFLITFTIFSENLRLTLRFQVTESQCRWRFFSRYTYGINLTVLRHFVLKIARSQTLASTSRPTKPQVKQWSYSLSVILQYQYTLGTMGWESILWLVTKD